MAERHWRGELDKASMVPLYRQLAQSIEGGIRDGSIPEGARLPSEQELIRRFAVSRVTVRQAMDALFEKRIIIRRQGIGTFAQRTVMTQEVDDLFGFYPSLLSRGLHPKIRILDYEIQEPEREVRNKLELTPGEKILRFTRQYLLEPSLFWIIRMHIPQEWARHWTRKEASTQNSFHLLQEKAGVHPSDSALTIRASLAAGRLVEWLRVPKGSPVLELRRLTFTPDRRPVEFAVLTFPGEAYELKTAVSTGSKSALKLDRR